MTESKEIAVIDFIRTFDKKEPYPYQKELIKNLLNIDRKMMVFTSKRFSFYELMKYHNKLVNEHLQKLETRIKP